MNYYNTLQQFVIHFTKLRVLFMSDQIRASHILVSHAEAHGATSQLTEDALAQIENLKTQFETGREFSDLAKEFSDCRPLGKVAIWARSAEVPWCRPLTRPRSTSKKMRSARLSKRNLATISSIGQSSLARWRLSVSSLAKPIIS